jgi:uncharacterized protein (TIGR00255 family)
MIRSMTGFGRADFEVEGIPFQVEVRTVNHRHLDVRIRLPRSMAEREGAIKARVQKQLARGKVDLTVAQPSGAPSGARLEIDPEVVTQLLSAAREMSAEHGLTGTLEVPALMSFPGVTRFVEPALSAELLSRGLETAVDRAVGELVSMREAEGESLARELEGRLDRIGQLVDLLEERAQLVSDAVREKLRRRSEQLRQELGLQDDARLHQEIVLAADRLDVTEELVRLRSHIDQFKKLMAEASVESPTGRRLDFLMQEMGREANTVGSKAGDAPLAHDVVELKGELERVREQVQNVE